jgi:hypothetical protein
MVTWCTGACKRKPSSSSANQTDVTVPHDAGAWWETETEINAEVRLAEIKLEMMKFEKQCTISK